MINEIQMKSYVDMFRVHYEELFNHMTIGGISKIDYIMEPEPTILIEIESKDFVANIVGNKFHGIKVVKTIINQ